MRDWVRCIRRCGEIHSQNPHKHNSTFAGVIMDGSLSIKCSTRDCKINTKITHNVIYTSYTHIFSMQVSRGTIIFLTV